MKIKFDRTTMLKLACLIILLVVVPFGAMELVFLVDLGGIDFAVTFLLVYFASIRDALIHRFHTIKSRLGVALVFLSGLYIFRPKVFVSHVSASGAILALTCSVFFACLLWLPLIYVSSGFIT